jgi:hypothetical protein
MEGHYRASHQFREFPLTLARGDALNTRDHNRETTMKKILTTIAVLAFAFSTVRAAVFFVPTGPATFNLNSAVYAPAQQNAKTNQTATSTNITQFFKSSLTKTPFSSSNMLALLANSFNTNFPAGSQIALQPGGLFVVDITGTNIIFSASSVVSFQSDATFFSSTETLITTQNTSGTSHSGNFTQGLIASRTLTYDDTLNTTADGTHTKFTFRGLYTVNKTGNFKTGFVKATSEFQGTGGGMVQNVQTLLTGTINGKSTGTQPGF